jgi:hypothetical protein
MRVTTGATITATIPTMMTIAMAAAMSTTITAAFNGAGAAGADADARDRARAADVLDRLPDPVAVADSIRAEGPRPKGAALLHWGFRLADLAVS